MLCTILTLTCLPQVYRLASEALGGVQLELEARLKPPQDLQDTLYKAKDGLPVPPDPVESALDAFAKQALGDIGGQGSTCRDTSSGHPIVGLMCPAFASIGSTVHLQQATGLKPRRSKLCAAQRYLSEWYTLRTCRDVCVGFRGIRCKAPCMSGVGSASLDAHSAQAMHGCLDRGAAI